MREKTNGVHICAEEKIAAAYLAQALRSGVPDDFFLDAVSFFLAPKDRDFCLLCFLLCCFRLQLT